MKDNKILIRDRSSFDNLENCVRITIGSKKQIIRVLDVIKKITLYPRVFIDSLYTIKGASSF